MILIVFTIYLVLFSMSISAINEEQSNNEIPSLHEVYSDYFPIGAAVRSEMLTKYSPLLKKHFNSLTPEVHMKFIKLQRFEGVFNFTEADKIVDFAMENGMKVRGHTLIWDKSIPDWLFRNADGGIVSREVLLKRMENHIKNVVGHFRGKVYCWDVVNEAFDGDKANYMWRKIIGDDYIKHAFIWAHEADPDALLFYNEAELEDPLIRKKAFNLIKKLKEEGIPIHGIGIQGHYTLKNSAIKELRKTIETFATLGLQIQITEMDVSLFSREDKKSTTINNLEKNLDLQATYYEGIFRLLCEYRQAISGVTFWGVADDYTYLDERVPGRKDYPLLFDISHQPKKAFWKIVDFKRGYSQ